MGSSIPISNIFDPVSTPAQAILEHSWLVLWICAGIFVIVSGLLVYTVRYIGLNLVWKLHIFC
jgi:heme/copper-type cytochrome/quinol oxidase subunit 2